MRSFLSMIKTVVAGLILVCLAAVSANAASENSVNSIIKSLAPIAGQKITKGYNGGGKKTRIEGRDVILNYDYAVDMEIYFPFDSARLTAKARRQLAALGMALSSEKLRPFRYLLVGHTDARGRAAYNKDLSRRRAAAVKRFLIENYAISPRRLLSVGWGEERLKTPDYPNAAINRRVQVIMILPDQSSLDYRYRPVRTAEIDLYNPMLPLCNQVEVLDMDDFHRRPGLECSLLDVR